MWARWMGLGFWLFASAALAKPVELLDAVTCERVEDAKPLAVADRFPANVERVFVFLKVKNEGPLTQVSAIWRREGKVIHRAKLRVKTMPVYRTWSFRYLREFGPGRWSVEVQNAEGERLGEVRFVVGDGEAVTAVSPAPDPIKRPQPEPIAEPDPVKPVKPEHAAKPESTKPESTKPESTKPESTKPESTKPESTKPESTKPESTKPESTKPESTKPESPATPGRGTPGRPDLAVTAPPGPGCRALVNYARAAGQPGAVEYAVAEVRITSQANSLEIAPGLVVKRGAALYALGLHSFRDHDVGLGGMVVRQYDELRATPLPDGPVSVWFSVPAALPPPEEPGSQDYREENRLKVVGLFGELVSLRASLVGFAGGPTEFDHSRYLTVRAGGEPYDPAPLFHGSLKEAGLRAVAQLRPSTERAPTPLSHDYRRAAFAVDERGRLVLKTLMPCCTFEENRGLLEVPIPVNPAPASLAGHLPDRDGFFPAPDGCGAVKLDGGRLLTRRGLGGRPRGLDLAGAPALELLGVYWIPEDAPFELDWLAPALQRLGR